MPNITSASNIKISYRVEIFQRFNPERIGGNHTDAILRKQHHKLCNTGYYIGYNIVYDNNDIIDDTGWDIRYDI